METRKVAVIGYPVKHSLSPKLHGYWLDFYKKDLEEKGIRGEYVAREVAPEELEDFILNMKENGYVGCNITLPHKGRLFDFLLNEDNESLSTAARTVCAVNTIVVKSEGGLFATNTDYYGFVSNIKENAPDFDFATGKAVVLGAGGAARAIITALVIEGVTEIVIINRTKENAEKIKEDVDSIKNFVRDWKYEPKIAIADWEDRSEVLEGANLLVNTTSLGMQGQPALDIDLEKLPKSALVTDIVYKPLETDLLKKAKERGNVVVDGLGMLLYQAVAGFKMWFGITPKVTKELREYIESEL